MWIKKVQKTVATILTLTIIAATFTSPVFASTKNTIVVQATEQKTTKNGFVKQGGKTYYYQNGKIVKGQKKINGYWYMFDMKTGAMKTSFFTHDKTTNPKGGAKKVYYDKNGRMVYGQQKINNKWYMFDMGSGKMVTGFYNHTKKTNPKGGAKTVYYNANGKMAYGLRKINNAYYYFDAGSGAMLKNAWKEVGGEKRYFGANGKAYTGTKKIGKTTYTFDKNGRVSRYISVSNKAYSLVNERRKKAGLTSIKRDTVLEKYAKIRAAELVKNMSHTRPNGTRGLSVIPGNLYKGEVLGSGQRTEDRIVAMWIASKGHDKVLTTKQYRKCGIACYEEGGRRYWVGLFTN